MSEPKGTCPGQVRRVKGKYNRNTVKRHQHEGGRDASLEIYFAF